MRVQILAAGLVLAFASNAMADEAVRTGNGGAPPTAAAAAPPLTEAGSWYTVAPPRAAAAAGMSRFGSLGPQDYGDGTRRVMAGPPGAEAPPQGQQQAASCEPPPDRKPHGELWAGVGTHGYREIGGVVTQPIGECGSATLAIDHVEGNFGRTLPPRR